MKAANTYLNFQGNTEEAFNFYKSVFGGEFTGLYRMSEAPGTEHMPEEEKNKIMNIGLPLGPHNVLMGTDMPESMGKLTFGNNTHICLATDSREETEKIFNGLAAGGTISMPLADMFWGSYHGALTDKFGVQWMIDYVNM
jgi:PhnB protein